MLGKWLRKLIGWRGTAINGSCLGDLNHPNSLLMKEIKVFDSPDLILLVTLLELAASQESPADWLQLSGL